MHSILKTRYFFDKIVEIGLLKVQYLRTTSEASLINLFLQLLGRVAEGNAVHCGVCTAHQGPLPKEDPTVSAWLCQ